MREEKCAQGDAQQQRGIGSGSGIDHGYLLFCSLNIVYS